MFSSALGQNFSKMFNIIVGMCALPGELAETPPIGGLGQSLLIARYRGSCTERRASQCLAKLMVGPLWCLDEVR